MPSSSPRESIEKPRIAKGSEAEAAVAVVQSNDEEALAAKQRPVNVARGLSSRHIQLFAIAGVIGKHYSCLSAV
jgi:amino acid permease